MVADFLRESVLPSHQSGELAGETEPFVALNTRKYEIRRERDSWFSLGDGLYIIPCEGLPLVYEVSAAERRVHLLINSMGELLNRPDLEQFIRSGLRQAQPLAAAPDAAPQRASRDDDASPCTLASEGAFGLMLSLTTNCNLQCSYCYIRGGASQVYMPWSLAEQSIDYAITECMNRDLKRISLSFHGQGEPSLSWRTLCRATNYFSQQCRDHGLHGTISLTTNGLINDRQIRFLAANRVQTAISMDSHTESLNALRPMRSGKKLLPCLLRTLRKCESLDLDYSVRGTITPLNVQDMPAFVGFLSKFTHCKEVQFEPLAAKGRASTVSLDDRFYDDYIAAFCAARREGIRNRVNVVHAAAQLEHTRSSFCHAAGKDISFCVSATGTVSSCYEHMDDTPDNRFAYGKYQDGAFCIRPDRRASLRNAVQLKTQCDGCYLSTTCAGDCYADKDQNGRRCYVNRGIARSEMFLLSLGNIIGSESQ